MNQADFDHLLVALVAQEKAENLLGIPGVYEVLAEHFNNDILTAWKDTQEESNAADR